MNSFRLANEIFSNIQQQQDVQEFLRFLLGSLQDLENFDVSMQEKSQEAKKLQKNGRTKILCEKKENPH